MNLLRKSLYHPKRIVVLGLILPGICLLVTRGFQSSAKEITYAEFEQLMQAKTMSGARVKPTLFPSIYRIEGTAAPAEAVIS